MIRCARVGPRSHWADSARARARTHAGGPASGKGTLCADLSKEYGLVHLSVGDLLRAEAASGSPEGEAIAALMRDGAIVPIVCLASWGSRAP